MASPSSIAAPRAPGPSPPPGLAPADPPPAPSATRLWLYGLGMLLPAVGFAWRYPLRGNSDQLTDIGKLADYQRAEFAGYVGGLALMFLLYLLALREARRLPPARALPAVFGSGAALAAAMAAMYPVS